MRFCPGLPSGPGSASRSRSPSTNGSPQRSGKPSRAFASTWSRVRGDSSSRRAAESDAHSENTGVRSHGRYLAARCRRHAVSFAVIRNVTMRSRSARSLRRAEVSASDSLSVRKTPTQPRARRSCSPSVQLQAICISCDWIVWPACRESSMSSTNGRPGFNWLITS